MIGSSLKATAVRQPLRRREWYVKMQILAAEEICKSYSGRRVVNGVSLRVGQGEVVGLLGPNGAGKTTTFYTIVGLIPPDTGRILLDEEDITDVPMYRRARQFGISYLPQ